MLVLAVSVWERFRQIPAKNLANLGLALVILVGAVILIKQAAKLNKIVVFMVVAAIIFVVGVTWVYQRSEPKFLTPVVDRIAPFFPSAPTPYSQRPEIGPDGKPAPKKPAPPPAPKDRR